MTMRFCCAYIPTFYRTHRRSAVEHELDASPAALSQNAIFDETGHFLLYASLLGVKIVNVETNRVVKVCIYDSLSKQQMILMAVDDVCLYRRWVG